jgi:hypothetical protein
MPALDTLIEADLHGLLNNQSLRRARGYIRRVQNPVRGGQTLTAEVRGTSLYAVEVEVSPGGVNAHCTCPYDWGGYCKHVGAVLLKWIRDPQSFALLDNVASVTGEYPIVVIPVKPPPTHRPEQLPDWVTASFSDRQQAEQQQLETWLAQIKLQDLRAMARARGWRVRGTRKADVVRQIVDQIVDPDGIVQAIACLDDEHRRALCALALLTGEARIPREDLERVAGIWGPLKSYKQIETYTRHLWQEGLALPGEVLDSHYQWNDFVPSTLGRHFPPLLDGIISTTGDMPSGAVASGLRLADPYALVRAANQVALLLEQAPVPLRPPMPRPRLERFYHELKGWDYDPAELALAEEAGRLRLRGRVTLTVPPPRRALPDEAASRLAPLLAPDQIGQANGQAPLDFLFSLLLTTGLFQPGSPTTMWREVKVEFMRRDELAQRALLGRAYLQMLTWNELWEVLRVVDGLQLKRTWNYAYFKPEHLQANLLGCRRRVLRVLASLPDNRWVALPDLFTLMRAVWPRFDHTVWDTYRYADSPAAWFLARNGRQLRTDDPTDWDQAQGNFVRQVVGGPLHWLGFADLHVDDNKLVAFRLHGLADLYWDRVEAPLPPRHAAQIAPRVPHTDAVVIDEFSITVNPSVISVQAHSLLDKIARLDVAKAERFVYRLDARAAYEAFESGVTLTEILNDWEHLLLVPISEPIRAQLLVWWQAYGRVRIYEDLAVIEFGDDFALPEVKAVTSLDDHLLAEISPRLVIIRREAMAPLIAQLEQAGYTPKQTDQV